MIAKFSYSREHFPYSPTMEVVFMTPVVSLSTSPQIALVDTGADATFAPVDLLEHVQAPIGETRRARSLWGEWRTFSMFIVDVRIGNFTYPAVEVVGYEGIEVILGRDVLNKLRVALDGPAETVAVSESKARRKRESP